MTCAGRGIVLGQIDRLFREGTLGGLGDGQLLERYLSRRDEVAFEGLVDRHGPMVLGLCRRMLRDPRDIEDAFQATFLVLVRKAAAIRDRGLLSSWLYGVAYRVARRARTQTLRRRGRETAVADLEVATAPETSDRLEISPVLDQELSRLPEKYRAPLVLCYLRGRTHDQAAEELRCPVGTVRSRLARGRDLLKQRLTRRGCAPTAAILGIGPTVPARLLSSVVPPSLVSTTVKAALGFGSSSTVPAGAAASAMALAHGVLATMKLKWIGLGILATSLSAGGVVAVSYAAAQSSTTATRTSSASLAFPDPQQEADSPDQGVTREDRLRALEQKVDELLRRLGGPSSATVVETTVSKKGAPAGTTTSATPPPAITTATTTPSDPTRLPPTPAGPNFAPRGVSPTATNPISELETQLRLALLQWDRIEPLFQRHAVSLNERELARGSVLVIASQLQGLDEDYGDEVERLKLELRRKHAECQKAEAQVDVARTVTARNQRLNVRKPGMVSEDDVAKAEAELKVAGATVAIAEAGVAEVSLRIKQLQRRRGQIRDVVALADRVKTARGMQ
jgi:RNA polymerase sigma factor (sigma-70 family)